jgi:hypothetical protein
VINRPKVKKKRIAFAPMNIRSSSDARTAPRLHSSDDGLFLATSTLRRLEEDVQHSAISAHSMSEPRIDVQFPVSKQSEGATERYKGLRKELLDDRFHETGGDGTDDLLADSSFAIG